MKAPFTTPDAAKAPFGSLETGRRSGLPVSAGEHHAGTAEQGERGDPTRAGPRSPTLSDSHSADTISGFLLAEVDDRHHEIERVDERIPGGVSTLLERAHRMGGEPPSPTANHGQPWP